jgi:hypothetical protein
MANRVGGIIFLSVNGSRYDAKGNFTYNIGRPMAEGVLGHDGVHGYKELPQIPFIEGEITDRGDLALVDLLGIRSANVTLELANGKTIVLRDAWFAADGTGNTEEGNIAVKFEGRTAEED